MEVVVWAVIMAGMGALWGVLAVVLTRDVWFGFGTALLVIGMVAEVRRFCRDRAAECCRAAEAGEDRQYSRGDYDD
jgi:hypothetical protein